MSIIYDLVCDTCKMKLAAVGQSRTKFYNLALVETFMFNHTGCKLRLVGDNVMGEQLHDAYKDVTEEMVAEIEAEKEAAVQMDKPRFPISKRVRIKGGPFPWAKNAEGVITKSHIENREGIPYPVNVVEIRTDHVGTYKYFEDQSGGYSMLKLLEDKKEQ